MKKNIIKRFGGKVKTFFFGTEDPADRYMLHRSLGAFNDERSQKQFLRLHEIDLYVNRGIDIRAQKVSEVEFVLKNKKGDIVKRNPVIDMLNRPNDCQTGKQFWKLWAKHYYITGNAFILKDDANAKLFDNAKVKSLKLLSPDRVEIVYNNEETEITKFKYTPLNGVGIEYDPEQIIYIYDPDPFHPLKGISMLRSGIRAIETDLQISEYQAKVLKNGGKVEGVFKFKTALTAKQITDMKEKYKEQTRLETTGDPLFLGGDADYVNLGLTPAEMSYLETKKITFSDICILTGVPEALLSLRDVKFDNADAAVSIFLREKVKPDIQTLVDALDWKFVPAEFDLEFIDPTPANQAALLERVKASYDTDSSTINERRLMLGMEERKEPEADELFMAFNKSPIGDSAAPAPVADPNAKKWQQKDFNHPLKDAGFRKKYGAVQLKRLDKKIIIFRRAMQGYFSDQEARIKEKLGAKKTFKTKGLVDEIFDRSLEIKLGQGFAIPLLRQFLMEAGIDAFDLIGSRFDFSMTGVLESWLEERTRIFAHEITDTTFNKLKDQFTQSFEGQETRQQLINRIESVYSGFDETRATTIARTEVHGAMQKGTVAGYEQSGVQIKIWVWAQGVNGGVREDHLSIDGEEVPIDHVFSNGLMFPGDPDGDPADTVNCECSI